MEGEAPLRVICAGDSGIKGLSASERQKECVFFRAGFKWPFNISFNISWSRRLRGGGGTRGLHPLPRALDHKAALVPLHLILVPKPAGSTPALMLPAWTRGGTAASLPLCWWQRMCHRRTWDPAG